MVLNTKTRIAKYIIKITCKTEVANMQQRSWEEQEQKHILVYN